MVPTALAFAASLAIAGAPAQDTEPPHVSIDCARTQHVLTQRAILVSVESSEDAAMRLTAHMDIEGSRRHFRPAGYKRQLSAGHERSFRMIVSEKDRKRLKRPLAEGRRVIARIRLSVRDHAGNPTIKHFTVRLL
jgi:hypothetical protein